MDLVRFNTVGDDVTVAMLGSERLRGNPLIIITSSSGGTFRSAGQATMSGSSLSTGTVHSTSSATPPPPPAAACSIPPSSEAVSPSSLVLLPRSLSPLSVSVTMIIPSGVSLASSIVSCSCFCRLRRRRKQRQLRRHNTKTAPHMAAMMGMSGKEVSSVSVVVVVMTVVLSTGRSSKSGSAVTANISSKYTWASFNSSPNFSALSATKSIPICAMVSSQLSPRVVGVAGMAPLGQTRRSS
mmetsp:Transcript_24561/g.44097  ORF Transcript_24561/g.44097 Transcript_24561/m.44097 type:complete len:240 (+) Transcript_24561:1022-1741(+)